MGRSFQVCKPTAAAVPLPLIRLFPLLRTVYEPPWRLGGRRCRGPQQEAPHRAAETGVFRRRAHRRGVGFSGRVSGCVA